MKTFLRMSILALCTIIMTGCKTDLQMLTCVESHFPNGNITRVDESSTRLFLVQPTINKEELKKSIIQTRKCFRDKKWKQDWSLSIFSDKQYVGYIREEHIQNLADKSKWAEAYLAEYYEKTKILKISPLISPQWISIPIHDSDLEKSHN